MKRVERSPDKGQVLFLDNVEFAFDVDRGLFRCLSIASQDMTIEDVRRHVMTMSFLQVVSVKGVPYLYAERGDTFYLLGNMNVKMTGDEFEQQLVQGRVSYPYGDAFRAIVQKEKEYVAVMQRGERDR